MNFQKSQLKDVVAITHHSLSKPLQVTQTGQNLRTVTYLVYGMVIFVY